MTKLVEAQLLCYLLIVLTFRRYPMTGRYSAARTRHKERREKRAMGRHWLRPAPPPRSPHCGVNIVPVLAPTPASPPRVVGSFHEEGPWARHCVCFVQRRSHRYRGCRNVMLALLHSKYISIFFSIKCFHNYEQSLKHVKFIPCQIKEEESIWWKDDPVAVK